MSRHYDLQAASQYSLKMAIQKQVGEINDRVYEALERLNVADDHLIHLFHVAGVTNLAALRDELTRYRANLKKWVDEVYEQFPHSWPQDGDDLP